MSNRSFEQDEPLDALRRAASGDDVADRSLERASQELQVRSDPNRVAPAPVVSWPWTREARARSRARDLNVQARVDIYKDDLQSIRMANEVLNRAATMRAVEAAETAIFEIRCLGETARFAILNRAHLEMTRQFVAQLSTLE